MKKPTEIYGWKDGDKFYTSLRPRDQKAPANQHETLLQALTEASNRGLRLVWEDVSAID